MKFNEVVLSLKYQIFNLMLIDLINFYFSVESGQAENLAQEMADLMHDYDIMSRYAFSIFFLSYFLSKYFIHYYICEGRYFMSI